MHGMFSVEKKAFDDGNDASGAVVASADHGNLKDFTFRHRVLFLEKEIKSCLFIGKHAEFIKLNEMRTITLQALDAESESVSSSSASLSSTELSWG